MKNEKLIKHLRASWDELEKPSLHDDSEVKTLDYLYFAPQVERASIHIIEKSVNYGFRDQCGLSVMQKNQVGNFWGFFDREWFGVTVTDSPICKKGSNLVTC